MPAVFVHGNPETAAVWTSLLAELDRDDVVCLSPPGFGAPVPSGWGATVDEYRGWLVDELTRIDGPIDLVGHDWGGGHVVAVAMARPDLLRSWASDILGVFDPEYVWHDLAQVWQTPDDGERWTADTLAAGPAGRTQFYQQLGLPADVAATMAEAFDEDMARCILALYRSAAQPEMARLGADLEAAAARPGLALHATDDPFVGSDEIRRRAAARAGARVAVLEGLGHWWMIQDPAAGAATLREFWAALPVDVPAD